MRDRLAYWLCNAILRTVATREYRDKIGGFIRYGMNAAARDERIGTSPPDPWWLQNLPGDDEHAPYPRGGM